eukprot:TRINITY_DN14514_c0_g1_i1.p1 TRINITY_DN14514_c0_g1~~TRINITY_DN14514_c0_g1_i1.p1  ORF type:complete len:235 (-),score=58.19 TRINITY_DN14514_c0_g1_i1:64-768(-)
MSNDDSNGAIEALTASIKLAERFAAIYLRGVLLLQLRRYQEAAEDFGYLINNFDSLSPTLGDQATSVTVGALYNARGFARLCVVYCTHHHYGGELFEAGGVTIERALDDLSRAIETSANDRELATALFNRALVYLYRRDVRLTDSNNPDVKRAHVDLDKAVRLSGERTASWLYTKALCYRGDGDHVNYELFRAEAKTADADLVHRGDTDSASASSPWFVNHLEIHVSDEHAQDE